MNLSSHPEGVQRTWYLAEGQTVENTNISDRGCAMLCTAPAWREMTKHLERKKRIQEAHANEQAVKDYLKDGSYSMTKYWANSMENMQKTKVEGVIRRKAQLDEERLKSFNTMMAENEADRRTYLEKTRRSIFLLTDAPKTLHSALALTETLYERDAQIKLEQEIRADAEHLESVYAKSVADDFTKFKEEKIEEKVKLKEKQNKLRVELLKTLNDDDRKIKKEKQRLREIKELEDMAREIKEIKTEEYHVRGRCKNKVRVLINESKRERQAYQDKVAAEEADEDAINAVYETTKHRIERIRREKEAERQRIKNEKTERIGQEVFAKITGAANTEGQRLQKAIDEQEAREAEKRALSAEKHKRLREERQQARKEFLAQDEQRRKDVAEGTKWAMINRLKNDEVYQEYLEQQRQKIIDTKLMIKADLTEQKAENERLRKEMREQERKDFETIQRCLKNGDKEYIEYAEMTIEEARKRGRDTYPLEVCLDEFKLKWGYAVPKRTLALQKLETEPKKQRPGKRTTCKNEDPTYGRCKCYKDRLFYYQGL